MPKIKVLLVDDDVELTGLLKEYLEQEGLAIARRVVEAHGGTVRASNMSYGGLCVELALPVKLS